MRHRFITLASLALTAPLVLGACSKDSSSDSKASAETTVAAPESAAGSEAAPAATDAAPAATDAAAPVTEAAGAAPAAGEAMKAEGTELNLYNWGNYTSPELLKKFEKETGVKVKVTDYDSNDTAITKVRAGASGFDLVVPSANYLPIWVKEGLLAEARPDQMPNFKNMDPKWSNPDWDPGRHYSVPWQWGATGFTISSKAYTGDINTSALFLDPPKELEGKINVLPEMNDVMYLTIKYFGGERCTDDKVILKKVRDKLVEAKPKWVSLDYGNLDKIVKGDLVATMNWNGASLRARLGNPATSFGLPKEGYPVFMDSVAILKDAKNMANAKLFMNFIMDPENAAMISAFAKYGNGIAGSEAFLPADMKGAPELKIDGGEFLTACPPATNDIYTAIWTEVIK
jgi:spermidine/putrescine transport system substrate-binding protein